MLLRHVFQLTAISFLLAGGMSAADADLILHNGRIVTVDGAFSVRQAVAVKAGRITAVGSDVDVLKERGAATRVIDLKGKTVLPGLIDSHVHITGSALSEAKAKLPVFDSIQTIQAYIREKAKTTPAGAWIVVPRTLPPRLKEMRMPTKADLDVTKVHPVAFDGSYVWSANSLALKMSGITKDTPNPPAGQVVKGPDGEPNGILRNAAQLLKGVPALEQGQEAEKAEAVEKLLRLYAAAGLTSVADRAVEPQDVKFFERMKAQGKLPVRIVLTWRVNSNRPVEEIVREIKETPLTTNQGDEWLKMGSFKVTLDGGQSVGTAYQRVPYGPFGKQLYGQTDPDARGMLFVSPEKLLDIFRAARDKGWQLTSHVQGGGAIDTLVSTFEKLNAEKPLAPTRSHVMHGSYMSLETILKMKKLGVTVDAQAAWLHLDGPALSRVFGTDKMRYFFPLRTFIDNGINVAGGSDHMLGYDKNLAVNPYNPFLNMWMAVTRRTTEGVVLYPEEAITRQEALKMHTVWAAWQEFSETQKGSIEAGKLGDLVVIDRDFLTCPVEEIRAIEPLMTIVGGNVVYSAAGMTAAPAPQTVKFGIPVKAGPMDSLLVKDYAPASSLVVKETRLRKAQVPVIDAHSHTSMSGIRTAADVDAWVKTMDEAGIETSVVFTEATGAEFDRQADLYLKKYPKRFQVWCGLDTKDIEAPGYPERAAKELERCYQKGARGVGEITDKGWGLQSNEQNALPRAKRLRLDDARLDPFWKKCAELKMPATVHIADHPSVWKPLGPNQERSPDFQGFNLYGKDVPSYEELLATRDRVLARHPKTTFIFCHLSNLGNDLGALSQVLDKFPNLYLDISARDYEIGRQPRAAGAFLEKYRGRVLFGTDMGREQSMYEGWWRLLETADEYIPGRIWWPYYGLALNAPTLRSLYRETALKVLNFR